LNTLALKTWLNDNVVNLTTQVLASRAITESRRVVAVFDSQLTKLILETPKQPTTTGAGMDYYIYEKVVGVAEKRLLGKSPLDHNCLLFPNVINHNHWNIMAVPPKHRLMVALDSSKAGSVKDARIICRWLYDKTKYNHPADAEKCSNRTSRTLAGSTWWTGNSQYKATPTTAVWSWLVTFIVFYLE
jgi:hypothetical protein